MQRLKLLYIALFCSVRAMASAPDSARHVGFTVSAGPGRIVAMDSYEKKWLKNRSTLSMAAEVNIIKLPCDSDDFARDYNYPTLDFGIRYNVNDVTMHRSPDPAWGQAQEVDYDSKLGNIVTFYGSFTRPFFRTHRWKADYTLGTGIAWGKHKYSKGNNIDNELTGSRWLIYFVAGLHLDYRFSKDWAVRGGVEFYHHSNGAINRPNKGANYFCPTLGIVYEPYYNSLVGTDLHSLHRFKPYYYINLTAAVGAKTLNEDWQKTQFNTNPDSADYRTGNFHVYPTYSARVDFMRRYARRWASGVGIDLFYGKYASRIAQLDKANGYNCQHSRFSLGISAKHQVFYHNLSAAMSLGYYVYRHMGHTAKSLEKPYYEQIGVNYTFDRCGGLTIGFSVKAHKTKADYTELLVSMPIRL